MTPPAWRFQVPILFGKVVCSQPSSPALRLGRAARASSADFNVSALSEKAFPAPERAGATAISRPARRR